MDNRQYRMLYLSSGDLLFLLNFYKHRQKLTGKLMDMPDDTVIVDLYYVHNKKAWELTLYSDTFSNVPIGKDIPEWEG
jgi:hypothetical protein